MIARLVRWIAEMPRRWKLRAYKRQHRAWMNRRQTPKIEPKPYVSAYDRLKDQVDAARMSGCGHPRHFKSKGH